MIGVGHDDCATPPRDSRCAASWSVSGKGSMATFPEGRTHSTLWKSIFRDSSKRDHPTDRVDAVSSCKRGIARSSDCQRARLALTGARREAPSVHVLIAPDKFKGSLTANAAALAMAAGAQRAAPHATVDVCPLADGGEGTVDVVLSALGGERRAARVTGPLGVPPRHIGRCSRTARLSSNPLRPRGSSSSPPRSAIPCTPRRAAWGSS